MQPSDAHKKQPTRLFNRNETNDVNIRDVSHVTMVTRVKPVSTGALLRLAYAGCSDPVA